MSTENKLPYRFEKLEIGPKKMDLKVEAISEAKFKKLFCDNTKKFNVDAELYFINELGEPFLYIGPVYFSTLAVFFRNIGNYAEISKIGNLRIKNDNEEYELRSSLQLEYFLEIRKRYNALYAKLSLVLLSNGIIDDIDDYEEGPTYIKENYVGYERSDESIGRAVAKRDQLQVSESDYAQIGKQERHHMINLDGYLFYKD